MLPQIWWVITAPFPKHGAHWYRSEAHSVSEVPGKWLQTQQWPGRVWYYASLNQNASCLILLDSEVIVCEQSRSGEAWKTWPPQAACIRLRPTPLSPFSTAEMKVRLSPLASSPLSFKRRRGTKLVCSTLAPSSFQRSWEWRGRRRIKLIILGP